MTSEDAVRELAEALLASPTVRLGDDVEPAWRDTLGHLGPCERPGAHAGRRDARDHD